MSLIPPGTASSSDITLYASVQVAVTCAALYDHALGLGREVELIWMKPPSLITALYVIERYLGDIVLMLVLFVVQNWPVFMLFGVKVRRGKSTWTRFEIMTSDLGNVLSIRVGMRLFQLRAWGALAYSWGTQVTMQLRIYALYRRSRQILVLLVTSFLCEIAVIAFVIWRAIGPDSSLKALTNVVPGEHFCAFYGVNGNFVYIFIPFLCFESFLFILAARVFFENIKCSRDASDEKVFEVNSFMSALARDSLCYFFVNLVACSVVMGLWRSVTELYANICIPFVMLLEVLVGTRLILDCRERYARPDDPVVSNNWSSVHFGGDDIQMHSTHISVRCQIETIVVKDVEFK